MENAILEFRPNEWVWYDEEPVPEETLRPGERLYAVAAVETPPFPGPAHEGVYGLAVVVAERHQTKGEDEFLWGWVYTGAETRDDIGESLVEHFGDPPPAGRWFYMIVGPYDTPAEE